MVRRLAGAFLAAALACAPSPARAADPTPAEKKVREEAALALVEYAKWCAKEGAKREGSAIAREAAGLDPAAPGLKEVAGVLDAMNAETAERSVVEKQRRAMGPSVAKLYDRLAAVPHDKADDGRFTAYFLRGLAWDPARPRVDRALKMVDEASARPEVAGRILVAARRADPSKARYDAVELKLAQQDLALVGSEKERSVAFVSLPKGWRMGKTYAVLVAVDGAGCNFVGNARSFRDSRGSRPVIVVEPAALSCTNTLDPAKYAVYDPGILKECDGARLDFDGPGLIAVLDVVKDRFGGEEKVFVTGFSGGGNLAYWMILRHPERLRGASPACANFSGGGLEGAPGAGPSGGPPIHLLTGEKDEHGKFTFGDPKQPGIEPQTDAAQEKLKELGYTRVRRTMVKGAGHSALQAQVWEFVDEVLGKK